MTRKKHAKRDLHMETTTLEHYTETALTRIPARVHNAAGQDAGWTVYCFATPEAAADFVQHANGWEHMPCWRRFRIVEGRVNVVA